jgi:glycosyltransferase involved in cell wall biosynthesis
MKIALVQDWFTVNGGAEKVIKEIVNVYSDVDVFALVDFLNDEDRQYILKGKKCTTSFLQHLPFAKSVYRNFLPLFPMAIGSLDFTGYDLIISSSTSVAKGAKKANKNQIHICYCNSPMRYAWDQEEEYLSHMGKLKKLIAKITLKYIRKWDIKTLDRVDLFIANSNNVAERIQRIYGRSSVVLYPPVDASSFTPELNKENYYFTSARFVPYKKIDLIIKAFNELPHLKLIVSGDGPESETLKELANENTTFVGFLTKEELIKHTQKAKAFILAADEDFGITSLEAQSCCTPVIAYKKGGYLETVVDGKTGLFFDEQIVSSLKETILKFENLDYSFKKEDFLENMEKFSISQFKTRLKNIVDDYVKGKNS